MGRSRLKANGARAWPDAETQAGSVTSRWHGDMRWSWTSLRAPAAVTIFTAFRFASWAEIGSSKLSATSPTFLVRWIFKRYMFFWDQLLPRAVVNPPGVRGGRVAITSDTNQWDHARTLSSICNETILNQSAKVHSISSFCLYINPRAASSAAKTWFLDSGPDVAQQNLVARCRQRVLDSSVLV
jgi:hypothetical protein